MGSGERHTHRRPRRATDESKAKWDAKDEAGLRFVKNGPLNVEYWRDVKPILDRSCVKCHTSKDGKKPACNLDLDADDELVQVENHGKFPGTYVRLALDERAKFGHKPPGWDSWGTQNASRYIRKFQSRRSLLVWKIYGARLDGFNNDDHPSEKEPGSGKLFHKGEKSISRRTACTKFDIDYTGARRCRRLRREADHRTRTERKPSRGGSTLAARSTWISTPRSRKQLATAGCSTIIARRSRSRRPYRASRNRCRES